MLLSTKIRQVFEFNKKEEDKTKNKKSRAKSNLVYNKNFTFHKQCNILEFARRYFYSKQNDLIEFKDILELFYHDNEEIKQNNNNKEKDLEQRKVVITASELYDKLLNIYKTLYDNLSKAHKKKVNVLNKPKKLNS